MNFNKIQCVRINGLASTVQRPGDILFSTVAGGPAHVHSPQDYCHKLGSLSSTLNGDLCQPVSLFNSLLDPNIELPTITVREVDAVLSNLSGITSLSTKEFQTEKIDHFGKKDIESPVSGDASNASHPPHSLRPDITADNGESPNSKFGISTAFSSFPEGRPQAFLNGALTGNNSERSRIRTGVVTTCVATQQICTAPLFTDTRYAHERVAVSKVDSRTLNECASTASIGCFHSSESEAVYPSNRLQLDEVAYHSSFSDSVAKSAAVQFSQTGGNVHSDGVTSLYKAQTGKQIFRRATLFPVTMSQTPFGSLDLATNITPNSIIVASDFTETDKLREANLNLRIANQSQLINANSLRSTTKSVSNSTIVIHPENDASPSEGSIHSSPIPPVTPSERNTSAAPLPCPPSSADIRFKYACPHPRCGRRYQAELTLLRHLSKYHREDVGLPQRNRLRRRPASEERSPAKDGMQPILNQKPYEGLKSTSGDEPTVHIPRGRAESWSAVPFNSTTVVRSTWCPDGLTATAVPTYSNGDVTVCSGSQDSQAVDFNPMGDLPSGEQLTFPTNSPSAHGRTLLKGSPESGIPSSIQSSDCDCLSVKSQSIWRSSPSFSGESELFVRQPRLRSASGSHDAQSESESHHTAVHVDKNGRHEPHTPHTNSLLASPLSALSHPVGEAWIASAEYGLEGGRRRTLSTGAAPRRALSGTHLKSSIELEQPCQSTCPSCGFGLNKTESKQREWMSGVHALTYSKTDSVCCPIDGCAYMCYGRADLSAHLTCSHFPEVQNQLVRLIFACPVKDCHMVCADEKNFQAHFNRHLFGYLPGDMSGLFPPVRVSSASGPVNAPIPKPDTPLLNSDGIDTGVRNVQVDPTHNSVLMGCDLKPESFPIHDIFPTSQTPLSSSTQDMDTLKSSHTPDMNPGLTTSITPSSDLAKLSSPRIRSRGSAPLSDTDLIEVGVDSDRNIASVKQQTELRDQSLLAPTSTGVTDTAHMDLTDHRNLVSALDLIPDDILMELLKEDRPGLWGDGVAPNMAMYSAPHTWDSPIYGHTALQDLSSSQFKTDCVNGFTVDTDRSGASSTTEMCDSASVVQPFPEDSVDQRLGSRNSSPALNCNSWVPSPVVHQTWSLAVANERPTNSSTSEADYSIRDQREDYAYDCPRHVLSELTAALILPDVERQLKASISTNEWTNTSVAPTTTPRSTVSESVVDLTFRNGRQACCSGKRRRNASESSPTGMFRQTSISTVNSSGHQDLPAKSSKQVTVVNEPPTLKINQSQSVGQTEVTPNVLSVNGHTPFPEPVHVPSLGQSKVSLKSIARHGKPTFFADVENLPAAAHSPFDHNDRSWTSHEDQTYCLSPKHMSVEPKKRRRRVHKVMTVTSDSPLPTSHLPSVRNSSPQLSVTHPVLSRRHSLIYFSLVKSADSPP